MSWSENTARKIDFSPAHALQQEVLGGLKGSFEGLVSFPLRIVEKFVRRGRIGQADFSCIATIPHEEGTLLCAMSVTTETYLRFIRAALPKELATQISDDNRDLLMSVVRRGLELISGRLKPFGVRAFSAPTTLVEGVNHSLVAPSNVESQIIVCESEAGPVYIEFAHYPKTALESET